MSATPPVPTLSPTVARAAASALRVEAEHHLVTASSVGEPYRSEYKHHAARCETNAVAVERYASALERWQDRAEDTRRAISEDARLDRTYVCLSCGHQWDSPEPPAACESCRGAAMHLRSFASRDDADDCSADVVARNAQQLPEVQ